MCIKYTWKTTWETWLTINQQNRLRRQPLPVQIRRLPCKSRTERQTLGALEREGPNTRPFLRTTVKGGDRNSRSCLTVSFSPTYNNQCYTDRWSGIQQIMDKIQKTELEWHFSPQSLNSDERRQNLADEFPYLVSGLREGTMSQAKDKQMFAING